MTLYILINADNKNILAVCDSELLALKREAYFKSANPGIEIIIEPHSLQYLDKD